MKKAKCGKGAYPVQSSAISRAIRTDLIGQGQRMSNWLYNMAQDSKLPDQVRGEMQRLYQGWDEIKDRARCEKGGKS